MNPPQPSLLIGDDELRSLLSGILAARFGHDRNIARLKRHQWDYYSSFTMEAMVAEFEDGTSLSLLVKDVGPCGRLEPAAAVKPAFLYDRLREIEVYRRILSPCAIDCPDYLGAEVNPSQGHYLLFLEHVKGAPLWQCGDIAIWRSAARWLADFHTRTAPAINDSRAAKLIAYDESYYSIWPRRATEFLTIAGAPAAALNAFESVIVRYDQVIRRLLSLPQSMIHGEFVASNIIIQSDEPGHRVRVVDWEMSAIGPAPMDLADLTAGKWTDAQQQDIANSYRQALPVDRRPDLPEFEAALSLCRLHKAMQWLGWSANWSPPKEHAADWLAEVVRLSEEIVDL